jgi:hypothetical protein
MSLLSNTKKRYLGDMVTLDNYGRAVTKVSVVRDPHEMLRFSDEDMYPHLDSGLVRLGEITSQT